MNSVFTLPILFSMPGPLELGIILAVAVLIFGAKRIPEIARGIGQGIKEFKQSISGINKDVDAEDSNKKSKSC